MERQNSYEPTMVATQLLTDPSSHSGLKIQKARSTTASVHCSASSARAPTELRRDPLGSGSYLRGVGLRPGRRSRCHPPKKYVVPIVGKEDHDEKCMDESETVDALLDSLPMEVAKMVINMQRHYAVGVEELTGKLGAMDEEMQLVRAENEELRRRLDMHFVMLRQASEFMRSVRERAFGIVDKKKVNDDGDVPILVEEEEEEGEEEEEDMSMEVPPTPEVDREPVRSTGRKVTKRRLGSGSYELRKRKTRRTYTEDENTVTGTQRTEASGLKTPRQEKSVQSRGCEGDAADDDEDDDDVHLKILAGAPRLQAMLRRSASAWTAINSRPRDTDPNADYRPCSPSSAHPDSDAGSASDAPSSAWTSPSPSPLANRTTTRNNNNNNTTSTPKATPTNSSPSSRPRYSSPRHTTIPRYASGPPGRRFRFHRMGRTVLDVWTEYKVGWNGNPAIEFLEKKYATGWRTGTLREIKYASNYVGVRQKVVTAVEEICDKEGISPEEACMRLGERADGRMQMLITAIRKGEDPLKVIPRR